MKPVIDQKRPFILIPEVPLTLTSTGVEVAVDEILDPEVAERVVVEVVPKTLEKAGPVPCKNSVSMLTSVWELVVCSVCVGELGGVCVGSVAEAGVGNERVAESCLKLDEAAAELVS